MYHVQADERLDTMDTRQSLTSSAAVHFYSIVCILAPSNSVERVAKKVNEIKGLQFRLHFLLVCDERHDRQRKAFKQTAVLKPVHVPFISAPNTCNPCPEDGQDGEGETGRVDLSHSH